MSPKFGVLDWSFSQFLESIISHPPKHHLPRSWHGQPWALHFRKPCCHLVDGSWFLMDEESDPGRFEHLFDHVIYIHIYIYTLYIASIIYPLSREVLLKYIHFTFKAEILFVMLFVSYHPNGRGPRWGSLCVLGPWQRNRRALQTIGTELNADKVSKSTVIPGNSDRTSNIIQLIRKSCTHTDIVLCCFLSFQVWRGLFLHWWFCPPEAVLNVSLCLGMSYSGVLCLLGIQKVAKELQSEAVEIVQEPCGAVTSG